MLSTNFAPVIVAFVIFPFVIALLAILLPVTATFAIAVVSTASLASSLAPTASAAICPEVIELLAIFVPAISPSEIFNFP